MVSKKMNHLKIKELRAVLEQDQPDFASNCGISTRTLVSVERGEAVSENTISKISDYLCNRTELEQYGQPHEINKMLKPKDSSEVFYGVVESDYAIEEVKHAENDRRSGLPGYQKCYDPYILLENPEDESEGWKDTEISDYSHLTRTAELISTDEESISLLQNAISKPTNIWLSKNISNTDDNSALSALVSFSEVINDIEKNFLPLSSLNDTIKHLEKSNKLLDSYTSLIDSGYHLYLGRQSLHHDVIPIFFIEDRSTKKLSYVVQTVHPRFMQNKSDIPYWTFTGNNGILERWPYMLTAACMGPEKLDPRWLKLCQSIIEDYNASQRETYDNLCRSLIEEHLSKDDLIKFEEYSKKINSIPF